MAKSVSASEVEEALRQIAYQDDHDDIYQANDSEVFLSTMSEGGGGIEDEARSESQPRAVQGWIVPFPTLRSRSSRRRNTGAASSTHHHDNRHQRSLHHSQQALRVLHVEQERRLCMVFGVNGTQESRKGDGTPGFKSTTWKWSLALLSPCRRGSLRGQRLRLRAQSAGAVVILALHWGQSDTVSTSRLQDFGILGVLPLILATFLSFLARLQWLRFKILGNGAV